jgi:hypothetical protein
MAVTPQSIILQGKNLTWLLEITDLSSWELSDY